jgi:hypothetical protein
LKQTGHVLGHHSHGAHEHGIGRKRADLGGAHVSEQVLQRASGPIPFNEVIDPVVMAAKRIAYDLDVTGNRTL